MKYPADSEVPFSDAMETQSSPRLTNRTVMAQDSYTAGIELSNACREFYRCRLQNAESIKKRLGVDGTTDRCQNKDSHRGKKSSLDCAMDRLRKEMSLLMDQDLSLMKQLLTLNESIEELKWQRRYVTADCSSLPLSSCELEDYSDTDMFDSELDLPEKCNGDFPTRSVLLSDSVTNVDDIMDELARLSTASSTLKKSTDYSSKSCNNSGKPISIEDAVVTGKAVTVCHGEQNSFDSGIHSDEERPILV